MSLPDVEAMGQTFLNALVTPTPVVTLVPAVRPTRFVRVWRTGGAAENRVLERAQLTVQGWDADKADAFTLTSRCRNAFLNNYTQMRLVRGVNEVGGLYFDPDPDTGIPRYTFTVEMMVRSGR